MQGEININWIEILHNINRVYTLSSSFHFISDNCGDQDIMVKDVFWNKKPIWENLIHNQTQAINPTDEQRVTHRTRRLVLRLSSRRPAPERAAAQTHTHTHKQRNVQTHRSRVSSHGDRLTCAVVSPRVFALNSTMSAGFPRVSAPCTCVCASSSRLSRAASCANK